MRRAMSRSMPQSVFLALQWGLLLFCSSLAAQPPAGAGPVTDPALITRVEGSEQGFVIFQERCTTCHGREEVAQAPSPETLRSLSARQIHTALTEGAMQVHAADLSDAEIRQVAESLSGELLAAEIDAAASAMPNQCEPANTFTPQGPAWNGKGLSLDNHRHQTSEAAGLSVEDIPTLELRWAFGFPGGVSAFGEPSVVGGRLFVGSDNGHVYSLDAQSGCVHWSFRAEAGVRNSPLVAALDMAGEGAGELRHAVFFGDLKANLYALDANNGALIWQQQADSHLTARMTASPAYHEGVLYVPMSAWEEGAGRAESYACCTFRGSVAAYEALSGQRLWKTYTINEIPQPTRINSAGTQLYAPAGGAVWNTPLIDVANQRLYVGTGNAYTEPAPDSTDAVLALNLADGELLWSYQTQADDAFMVGCGAVDSENCPQQLGPDNDIPAALMLHRRDDGSQRIIVVSRTEEVLALSPAGELDWRQAVPGGIIWGGTSDGEFAYYGLNSGGLVAIRLQDGSLHWRVNLGSGPNGALASSIDGAVFIGGISGLLNVVDSQDGSLLWQYPTARSFETVNGVEAAGGTISAAGAVIADGMVYVPSGYQVIYGEPGNVLLAFAPAK